MNITTILEQDLNLLPNLSANEHWRKTDYYELCSDSQFYGNAHLIILAKEHEPSASAALIILLQRALIESNLLDDKLNSPAAFIDRLVSSGFFLETLQGTALDIIQFWNDYSEISESILESPNAELIKNGNKITPCNLLEQKEVISVIAFANLWNNRQYFIETNSAWLFFDWATMM